MSRGRVVLLLTSPRVAPGLLSWDAWQTLHAADVVYTAGDPHPQVPALEAAGVTVTELPGAAVDPGTIGRGLIEAATAGAGRLIVWLAPVISEPDPAGRHDPDGRPDPDGGSGLGRQLGHELTAHADPPELELLPASYDLPGARLLDLVRVMDRLRNECAWVRAQDHRSLVRYLVEEAYETVEAIESGDRAHLREELGDLLFQVVFHSRLAEEETADGYSIDDVAADLAAKLIRRNPHVFGSGTAESAADIEDVWDRLKSQEKRRDSVTAGIPPGLPALALADKVLERVAKAGLAEVLDGSGGDSIGGDPAGGVDRMGHGDEHSATGSVELGETLLVLVARARAAGIDPEQALRDAVGRFTERVRRVEPPPDPR